MFVVHTRSLQPGFGRW